VPKLLVGPEGKVEVLVGCKVGARNVGEGIACRIEFEIDILAAKDE
jgi:hypothetical protein